jgi:antitoxin PrlF
MAVGHRERPQGRFFFFRATGLSDRLTRCLDSGDELWYHIFSKSETVNPEGVGMTGSVRFGIVQKRGQVTIPVDLRRKLGVEEGDVVAFVETDEGILISPREVLAMDALDRIGKALQKQGITVEELIATGREARGRMLEEE